MNQIKRESFHYPASKSESFGALNALVWHCVYSKDYKISFPVEIGEFAKISDEAHLQSILKKILADSENFVDFLNLPEKLGANSGSNVFDFWDSLSRIILLYSKDALIVEVPQEDSVDITGIDSLRKNDFERAYKYVHFLRRVLKLMLYLYLQNGDFKPKNQEAWANKFVEIVNSLEVGNIIFHDYRSPDSIGFFDEKLAQTSNTASSSTNIPYKEIFSHFVGFGADQVQIKIATDLLSVILNKLKVYEKTLINSAGKISSLGDRSAAS